MAGEYDKELNKQKSLSPCVVASNERILFVLIDPLQWTKGTFSSSAFRTTWLNDCSQSVARQPYSSPERLRRFVVEPLLRNDPDERELVGAVGAPATAIRKITIDLNDDTRAFVVLDDAVELEVGVDYAHAVLGFTPELSAKTKNYKTAAVGNLKLAFLRAGDPRRIGQFFMPWPFWMGTLSQLKLLKHRVFRRQSQEKMGSEASVSLNDEGPP